VGSPLIATVTIPVKPLTGAAFTLICCPAPPATSVTIAGVEVSEKSATGAATETVTATVAEWLRVPEVPVKVIVALPAAAVEAAVSVIFCAVPGAKVSVAGLVVTPVGSPLIATVTIPVKPLTGAAFTLICCPAPPATSVTDPGADVSVKSAPGVVT